MKFSVCTDAVLGGMPTWEAMQKVSSLGFDAVEFWSWWDKDLDAIAEAKEKYCMDIAAICTKFVSLTDKSKRSEYTEGLAESIEVAKKLGAKRLISQTGDDTGKDRSEQHQNLVEGLRLCVPMLEKADITLVVEPLNTYINHRGYYLYSSKEGYEIIDEVASHNVKLLFDIYHQQIMEGNLINNIVPNILKTGHFHAAGHPGRHELDNGEINYPKVFDAIENAGYKGYVGLEYFPLEDAEKGLKDILQNKNGL